MLDLRYGTMYDVRTFKSRTFLGKIKMSKTIVYTLGIKKEQEYFMPKKSNADATGFGYRLASFRKYAGYTQQELANEIGVSRRIIAYYEGETKHPPTTILPKLAVALGVTTDALLNAKSKKENNSSPISSRLHRKLRQIEKLGTKEKRQAMQLLDMFIEREQLKNKTMKAKL